MQILYSNQMNNICFYFYYFLSTERFTGRPIETRGVHQDCDSARWNKTVTVFDFTEMREINLTSLRKMNLTWGKNHLCLMRLQSKLIHL